MKNNRLLTMILIAAALIGCAVPADSTTLPPAATEGEGITDAPTPTTEYAPAGSTQEAAATAEAVPTRSGTPRPTNQIIEYSVPGQHPHDVAVAQDGRVWYTGQLSQEMGLFDPVTGETTRYALPQGASPHGVIVGPDGAAWITDSGLNAIVRVEAETFRVQVFELPGIHSNANLNTAVFNTDGILWFTGQSGMYGRLDPATGEMQTWDAPRGRGPYGITATPGGDIYYASLAGSHIACIDTATGEATVIEPLTPNQGARRVWSDSQGRIWVSEWNVGQLGLYDPASDSWQEWKLPGTSPQAYAVYVDDQDMVWVTDFGGNALHRFDPATETFETYPFPDADSTVRQLLGRPGEVWGAESALNRLFVIYTTP